MFQLIEKEMAARAGTQRYFVEKYASPTIFCEPIANGGHALQSVVMLNVVCLVGRLIYHFSSCVHCAVRQMRTQK